MTVTRVEVLGGVAASTITPSITGASSSISGVDLSTFPTGAANPFVVVIDRGTASEEKILITSRSGNTLTVNTRGYDGTSAASHALGAAIEHCLDALTVDSANKAAAQTIGKVTTAGDLIYGTASETMARLGIGAARQQLATNAAATAPEWVASLQSLMTAQGDIVQASSANTPARLAIGTARQNLAVNSGATAVEYVASPQSLMTTTGDILYASSANTPARLAAGTSGYVLTSGGAGVAPSWAAAAGSGITKLSSGTRTTDQTGIGTSFTTLTSSSSGSITVPAAGVLLIATMTFQKKTGAGYGIVQIYDSTAAAAVSTSEGSYQTLGIDEYGSTMIALWHAPGAGARTYELQGAAQANTIDVTSWAFTILG